MSRIVLPYFGEVDDDGNIYLPKKMRSEISTVFRGMKIEISVKKAYKRSSTAQKRYYFGVLIPYVIRIFIAAGTPYQEDNQQHLDLIEEMMRRKFGLWESIVDPNGEEEKILVPLSAYSTMQQEELNEDIRRWALDFFNVRIPLPNEQLKIY